MGDSKNVFIRRVDEVGRVFIPKELRDELNIKADDDLNIILDEENNCAIIRKASVS